MKETVMLKFIKSKPALIAFAAVGLVGYGGSSQALYYKGGTATLWKGRSIPLCFQQQTRDRADFQDLFLRIKQLVGRSWTQATGLRFTGWNTICSPTGSPGLLNIAIHDGPAGGQTKEINGRVDMNLVQGPSVNNPYADFESRVIHEFGHALGFAHEFTRPDSPIIPAACGSGDKTASGGDTLNTPYDSASIMNATYACSNAIELSYWDALGSQNKWGRPNYFADVNGDGGLDAIVVNRDGVYVRTSNGSSFPVSAQKNWTGRAFYGQKGTFFADVTGDGKADAIAVNNDGVWVRTSMGSSFAAAVKWTGGAFYGQRGTFFADVNGDGLADAIAVNNDGVWVRISIGSSFPVSTKKNWTGDAFYGQRGTFFADVTGDGLADAIAVNDDGVWIRPSTGNDFPANSVKNWTNGAFYGQRGTYFDDLTGDGRADAIAVNEDGIWVRMSTGSDFPADSVTNWADGAFFGSRGTFFGDLTGDRKADAIAVNNDGVWVRTSTGSTFPVNTTKNWTGGAFYGLR
jgi:hypothetical protein